MGISRVSTFREKHIFSMSGNFEIGQGNLKIKQEVREKSGNFGITSYLMRNQELRLRQFVHVCLLGQNKKIVWFG